MNQVSPPPHCTVPFSARGYESYVRGDATQEDIRAMGNGLLYQAFRAQLLSEAPPRPCQGCGLRWSL